MEDIKRMTNRKLNRLFLMNWALITFLMTILVLIAKLNPLIIIITAFLPFALFTIVLVLAWSVFAMLQIVEYLETIRNK